ncbi:MAG: hypothetical protein AABZ46_03475 [Nitrospirota bacterium]
MSYSILNDHGGSITAESNAGTGTTFRLEFPVERRMLPRGKNKKGEKSRESAS